MAIATFTLIINSPATTAADITIVPVAGLQAPVPPGTVVATVSVTKPGWVGSISTDDPALSIGGATPNYTLIAATVLQGQNTPVAVSVTP